MLGNRKGDKSMIIKVATDYTDTPGARYYIQGPFPGEEFRDKLLYPKYLECYKNNEILTVDLDGGYGYGSSFLEEAFGGLIRRLKSEKKDYKKTIELIKIISNDDISWVSKIDKYMKDEINKK